ncbi:hypothetical protein BC628DRAFT_1341588 [Trametes gibbosa]|nr:hypothetical protein BC628DRAFT_1341588 [Trametes gibbosa]
MHNTVQHKNWQALFHVLGVVGTIKEGEAWLLNPLARVSIIPPTIISPATQPPKPTSQGSVLAYDSDGPNAHLTPPYQQRNKSGSSRTEQQQRSSPPSITPAPIHPDPATQSNPQRAYIEISSRPLTRPAPISAVAPDPKHTRRASPGPSTNPPKERLTPKAKSAPKAATSKKSEKAHPEPDNMELDVIVQKEHVVTAESQLAAVINKSMANALQPDAWTSAPPPPPIANTRKHTAKKTRQRGAANAAYAGSKRQEKKKAVIADESEEMDISSAEEPATTGVPAPSEQATTADNMEVDIEPDMKGTTAEGMEQIAAAAEHGHETHPSRLPTSSLTIADIPAHMPTPDHPNWLLQSPADRHTVMEAYAHTLPPALEPLSQAVTYVALQGLQEVERHFPSNVRAMQQYITNLRKFNQQQATDMDARVGVWFDDFLGGLDDD